MNLPEICRQRAAALLASGQRRILGIAAPPGAGKSTLAQALQQHFGTAVQVVPMDGFHLANSTLEHLGRRQRKGAADTFDAAGYVQLLQRIKAQRAGEVIYAPEFHRDIEEAVAGAIAVSPEVPLVVTEGNYLLLPQAPWGQVRPLLDEAWYLEVPDALRQARLLARHRAFGRSAAAAAEWVAATDEPNARQIARHRGRADLQIAWN